MKNMDGFIIIAFGLWQMGAGIALVVGLLIGAEDALQRTPRKDIHLFDTQAKVIWFVYGLAHMLAYAAFGGFSSSPAAAEAPEPPPEEPEPPPPVDSKKRKPKRPRPETAAKG